VSMRIVSIDIVVLPRDCQFVTLVWPHACPPRTGDYLDIAFRYAEMVSSAVRRQVKPAA
jgi:hypothetical protein